MDARVGPTGDGEIVVRAEDRPERGTDLAFDGAQLRLRGPAAESAAVLFNG
jgi:hypothetical protein